MGSGTPPPSAHSEPISMVSIRSSSSCLSILYLDVRALLSNSCPRVDPRRQGKHLPQLSCAVNSKRCSRYLMIGNFSGRQTTEACPSRNPFCENDSKSTVRSFIFFTGTKPPSGPPICSAFTFLRNPPPSLFTTMSRGVPISTSYIPGLLKKPSSETSLVPVDFPLPMAANALPPLFTTKGMQARVSTLFTTVGLLNRPCCVG